MPRQLTTNPASEISVLVTVKWDSGAITRTDVWATELPDLIAEYESSAETITSITLEYSK